jgi:hypothetical protein
VLLGPVDEVGHDEEVAGEAHLDDDADLVVGAAAHLVGDAVRVPAVEPLLDFLDEQRLLGLARGHRVARHVVRAFAERDRTPFGNQ